METISLREARRLALARAGLLKPEWTGLPRTAGRGAVARTRAAHAVISRFGYLQLDTVSIAGARSHALVLLSRLPDYTADEAEALLQPEAPLFEYWGHEASWLPLELYPAFAWRRKWYREHPWWENLMKEHAAVARRLRRRIRTEGALRSIDMEGRGSRGWWNLKTARRVAAALWSSGHLAVRERRNFQRSFDLAERVIPPEVRRRRVSTPRAFRELLLLAASGHGWATPSTLAATWRMTNRRSEIRRALDELVEAGELVPCTLTAEGKTHRGVVRPQDLELAHRLNRVRPPASSGVLLSPFDPVLWDRARVRLLFGFDQVLEIFKPAPVRIYGYYCLPVLCGEHLVGRVDLKADRAAGRLRVLRRHVEASRDGLPPLTRRRAALNAGLQRLGGALELTPQG